MDILVVAAHPDDEVLGCGGSIAIHKRQGNRIHVAFMADGISSRCEIGHDYQDELRIRRMAAENAANILGIDSVSYNSFPDNKLDTVPLLEIVKAVEDVIQEFQPGLIFTHHTGDLNIDHRKTHEAVITACRPQNDNPVKTILFFEVPSSTEWQIADTARVFKPNWFVDISNEVNIKKQVLEVYEVEIHKWPHPRSIEGVEHLARWHGATMGVEVAEAFILGRNIE